MLMTLATFTNEDENEDEDWYDRLGPGTRTSSTAVFRRETKTLMALQAQEELASPVDRLDKTSAAFGKLVQRRPN